MNGVNGMGQHIEESSMSLAACDNLARWDNHEQARYVAAELLDEFGGSWTVVRHHSHYHVVGTGEYYD